METMASLSTDITPTTVLVALVVISYSLSLMVRFFFVKEGVQEKKEEQAWDSAGEEERKRREKERTRQEEERNVEREHREEERKRREEERTRQEEERKHQEEEKERIELVLKKMNMTLEQVRKKTPEQKRAFTY